jgi:flagellar protein FliS
MTMNTDARAAYVGNSVTTASPARLLVMLFDRLVLDVQRGLDALEAGDRQESHTHLLHAQDIVMELRGSLKVEDWDGGPGLASIYDWLHTQLIKANMSKNVTIAQNCLQLVTDLAETWREAAIASYAETPAAAS